MNKNKILKLVRSARKKCEDSLNGTVSGFGLSQLEELLGEIVEANLCDTKACDTFRRPGWQVCSNCLKEIPWTDR